MTGYFHRYRAILCMQINTCAVLAWPSPTTPSNLLSPHRLGRGWMRFPAKAMEHSRPDCTRRLGSVIPAILAFCPCGGRPQLFASRTRVLRALLHTFNGRSTLGSRGSGSQTKWLNANPDASSLPAYAPGRLQSRRKRWGDCVAQSPKRRTAACDWQTSPGAENWVHIATSTSLPF